MKPAYENVARAFASESKCVVAQMNADEPQNKPVASKYDVRSFPTIKFFPKGADKTPVQYSLGRTEEQFVEVGSQSDSRIGALTTVPQRALRHPPNRRGHPV